MATLYRCPDCKDTHAFPISAFFVLAVRCADCEITQEFITWRILQATRRIAAAA